MTIVVANIYAWDSGPKVYAGTPRQVAAKLRKAYPAAFKGVEPGDHEADVRRILRAEGLRAMVRG